MKASINPKIYNDLKRIFHSNQNIFEILYVYHGLKDVARLTLTNTELEKLKKFTRKYNFSTAIQDYKFASVPDKGKGSFPNKGKRVSLENPKGKYIVYISKLRRKALAAKRYEQNTQDRKFGNILGYPECCAEFFIRNLEEQSEKQMDFVLPALNELKYFPFINNIAIRYFGIRILSHFPCSFDCEKSKKLGKKYFEIIEMYNPGLAKYYEKELKSFVLYTEYDGVFYSPDYSFENNMIKYSSFRYTTRNSKVYILLSKNNTIECTDYNKFKIGDKIFKRDDYGILLFK